MPNGFGKVHRLHDFYTVSTFLIAWAHNCPAGVGGRGNGPRGGFRTGKSNGKSAAKPRTTKTIAQTITNEPRQLEMSSM